MVLATSVKNNENNDPDLAYCERIASTIKSTTELPAICQHYPNVIQQVKAKNPQDTSSLSPQDIAFQGMRPGAAIQARRSRSLGIESDAKLKRRMTSSNKTHHHWQPQKSMSSSS
eukprot:CAMPEP_0113457970 /NCGR_PEP_ID=MMETSP0014_2-20120614/9680_1 /TAXON_ID=2857 /ORGANISM="Nitzschia sp." /LENGTH=114 /DNA_ID=CAMNT_0000349477 /DNA_START=224 /DNA_END=568 /DNA_ORIENTATION=- /assembly_acc=CAM_ASM_000159